MEHLVVQVVIVDASLWKEGKIDVDIQRTIILHGGEWPLLKTPQSLFLRIATTVHWLYSSRPTFILESVHAKGRTMDYQNHRLSSNHWATRHTIESRTPERTQQPSVSDSHVLLYPMSKRLFRVVTVFLKKFSIKGVLNGWQKLDENTIIWRNKTHIRLLEILRPLCTLCEDVYEAMNWNENREHDIRDTAMNEETNGSWTDCYPDGDMLVLATLASEEP